MISFAFQGPACNDKGKVNPPICNSFSNTSCKVSEREQGRRIVWLLPSLHCLRSANTTQTEETMNDADTYCQSIGTFPRSMQDHMPGSKQYRSLMQRPPLQRSAVTTQTHLPQSVGQSVCQSGLSVTYGTYLGYLLDTLQSTGCLYVQEKTRNTQKA